MIFEFIRKQRQKKKTACGSDEAVLAEIDSLVREAFASRHEKLNKLAIDMDREWDVMKRKLDDL